MIDLIRRQIELLKLLSKQREYKPASFFSKSLDVSTKTIYTDITYLQSEVEKYEVDLQIEYGDLSLPKDTPHDQYREEDGEVSYRISASEKNAGKKISVINEEGDVKVRYR